MALKRLALSRQSGVRFGALALGFTMTLCLGAASHAAVTSPCDPQYMDALEGRAYLEAQREIMQNQNLIVKPDSVLEYSCFDSILRTIARANGDRSNFSESNRWGEVPNHGTQSLDNAIQAVVGASLTSYITANFNHNYLGGRAAINYTPTSVVPGSATYSCSEMARVWQAAKCMNFFDRTDDQFFDFPYYTNNANDPRKLPQACNSTAINNTWMNRAFNSAPNRYTLSPENPLDAANFTVDNVTTYLSRINPVGVAPAANCDNNPIPTGVVVYRQGFAPEYYYEKVCTNPGCYYVPSGAGTQAAPSNAGQCQQ
jgi:hypothetical protein